MHDTLEQIECPACGKIMQKIPMSESGTMIDICLDGCGGIFFDGQELKHFDEQNENIKEIEKAVEGKTFNKLMKPKLEFALYVEIKWLKIPLA